MEWLPAEVRDNGAFQKTKLPHKYSIAWTITEKGLGLFHVSHGDEVFGVLYVNNPRNRLMVREIGRGARVLCASHAAASDSPDEGRFATRPATVRED